MSIYFLAFINSSFSFFLKAIAFYSSFSACNLLAAATALSFLILFSSASRALTFSSSALRARAALIFSSAYLIRSSFDRLPWYCYFISPSPSWPTMNSYSLRSASSQCSVSHSIAPSTDWPLLIVINNAFSEACFENPISSSYLTISCLTYDVIGVPWGAWFSPSDGFSPSASWAVFLSSSSYSYWARARDSSRPFCYSRRNNH